MMNEAIAALKQAKRILVIGHISPDGDTLGSGGALVLALRKLGKHAVMALDDEVPNILRFSKQYIEVLNTLDPETSVFDCAVAVDCADVSRMGAFAALFEKVPVRMVIDHHMTNRGYANINLILDKAATGLIVMEVIKELDVKIDEAMANLLYAAISTDTGNFRYSNVDYDTLHAAANLRKWGADVPLLCKQLYSERSLPATKLLGRVLDRLKIYEDGKIAVLYVVLEDYRELGANKEDCEELVNYGRDIYGIEAAIFLRQVKDQSFKVSLRANGKVDVTKIALRFGGGGHYSAAGCSIEGPLEDCITTLVAEAKKQL